MEFIHIIKRKILKLAFFLGRWRGPKRVFLPFLVRRSPFFLSIEAQIFGHLWLKGFPKKRPFTKKMCRYLKIILLHYHHWVTQESGKINFRLLWEPLHKGNVKQCPFFLNFKCKWHFKVFLSYKHMSGRYLIMESAESRE